jgi:quercetin dioxygenase-like cupin family protein
MPEPLDLIRNSINNPYRSENSPLYRGDGETRVVGRYVRRLDDMKSPVDAFSSIVISQTDSAIALKSSAPPGKGVRPHRHPVNQYLFILEGELDVYFGSRLH